MKTKVYISKPNRGWSEVIIPGEYQQFSYEKLVNSIHALLNRSDYKGLLITENPSPFESYKPEVIREKNIKLKVESLKLEPDRRKVS